jgi:hypothetical protein
MALAPITNYATLVAAVAYYVTRSDLDLEVFVQAAHVRLCREVRSLLWVQTATVTVATERVAVPDGFRSIVAAKIGDYVLQSVTPTERQRLAFELEAGTPAFVSIEGAFFAFAPIPSVSQSMTLQYVGTPALLSDTATTNALLTRYPMAYLYGTICEVARKLQDNEMMTIYEGLTSREIEEINSQDRNDAMGAGPLVPRGSSGLYPP